ncbi:MAG TPA: PEP/pyruvate-binding domain-containing protein [Polyangia bacterium]|nr:PEP/pyruvate-binding domain-containing protein [Polyangia bacterium]
MNKALIVITLVAGCSGGGEVPQKCEITAGAAAPDYLQKMGCYDDFRALASEPLDATIPGARSVKVVLDQFDKDALYFQNSVKFKIHHTFADKYLSGPAHPLVPMLAEFNRTQYTSAERRFLLGAITYYEGPKVWALEIAPYDTASPAMIAKLYEAVKKASYFGGQMFFHPTSQTIEESSKMLSGAVRIKTTAELFAQIDYQPLNTGTAIGQLRFVRSADLATTYVGFRDIVVMDASPGDISVTAAIITEEFQTPLSHINVLAQNRGTPNMGLRKAMTNPALRALEGKWCQLSVGPFEYTIKEVSMAEADAFWEKHKPVPVILPELDTKVTDLRNIEDVVVEGNGVKMRDAILAGVRGYGAKAAGYSVIAKTEGVPTRKAFAIPATYYLQFMEANGFFARVDTLLADPEFKDKAAVRDTKLRELRTDMLRAPVDPAFSALLKAKISADYPNQTMRFRSSTNAEDLDGFPCAGCYDSHTGDPVDWDGDLLMAVKQTWATVWKYRTFEERSYHSIDHKKVGMALLVHHNFPMEEANGVAVTSNPFDQAGLEPGFYINVQMGGDAEVVKPPPGVTSDEFLYQFSYPGQPIIYLSHSSLIPAGTTVLTREQIFQLGTALDAIHKRFSPAFGPEAGNTGWYAMDIEFKFDGDPGETPKLYVKQARPYPGRGTE